jgi:RNA polymerase sigma factor (sigma-70 family)
LWTAPPSELTVNAVQHGDPRLFGQLHAELHHALLHRFIRDLQNNEDACDVEAATWARAYLKRESYAGRGSVASWIWALGKRELLQFVRANKGRCVAQHGCDVDRVLGAQTSEAVADALLLRTEDQARMMRAMLQHISRRQSSILLARIADGKSFDTIAEHFGITSGTARATYRDAAKNLRLRLHALTLRPREADDWDYTNASEPHPPVNGCYDDWAEEFSEQCSEEAPH